MDNESVVKLSVIVPIYNSKKYLNQCIDSIIKQHYSNMEIILVDDGSTDGSGEICDLYKKLDQRIQVIHQVNKGCICSRLSGLQHSKGKYIGFVDSDDWIDADMYKVLMTVADEKKCDIVSMGYTIVCQDVESEEDDATLFGLFEKERNLDILLSNMMYDAQENKRGVHPSLCSKVIKRELLLKSFSGIDESINLGEDAAVFYPCCLEAERICIIKEYKYYYRIHMDSMCRNLNINTFSNIYDFYLFMKKRLVIYSRNYGLLKQLKMYVWEFLKLSLNQVFNIDSESTFLFPYDIVDKGSDIILYGAGKVGRTYYEQIKNNHYCNIVAWVDKNKNGWENIIAPNQINNLAFSKVVVAIMNEKIANEVIRELILLGLKKEMILWKKPQILSACVF